MLAQGKTVNQPTFVKLSIGYLNLNYIVSAENTGSGIAVYMAENRTWHLTRSSDVDIVTKALDARCQD